MTSCICTGDWCIITIESRKSWIVIILLIHGIIDWRITGVFTVKLFNVKNGLIEWSNWDAWMAILKLIKEKYLASAQNQHHREIY